MKSLLTLYQMAKTFLQSNVEICELSNYASYLQWTSKLSFWVSLIVYDSYTCQVVWFRKRLWSGKTSGSKAWAIFEFKFQLYPILLAWLYPTLGLNCLIYKIEETIYLLVGVVRRTKWGDLWSAEYSAWHMLTAQEIRWGARRKVHYS